MNCDRCKWARPKNVYGTRWACRHPKTTEARALITPDNAPSAPRAAWQELGIVWDVAPGVKPNRWPWSYGLRSVRSCMGWQLRLDAGDLGTERD